MHIASALLVAVLFIPSRAWLPSSLHVLPRRTISSRQSHHVDVTRPRLELPIIDERNVPHADVSEWVVFSDLHLSDRSLPTCLEVLETVHRTAQQRGAGIAFLGDWWHVRGSLNVKVLNACLDALSEWEAPVILLPGNHDQVSLGGLEHALTPLAFALRRAGPKQCVVIDKPSVFLGALWVPYMRDQEALAEVLRSPQALEATAVFCHAEVTGARMNDGLTTRRGIAPADFPLPSTQPSADELNKSSSSNEQHSKDWPLIPVVSGHFHKPHIVRGAGRVVRYCGSLWQTSHSEAGERKALLIYARSKVSPEKNATSSAYFRSQWQCISSTEITIGWRHFRATVKDLPMTSGEGVEDDIESSDSGLVFNAPGPMPPSPHGGSSDASSSIDDEALSTPRPGDRLIVEVSSSRVSAKALADVRALRDKGVLVELRRPPARRLDYVPDEPLTMEQFEEAASSAFDGWPLSDKVNVGDAPVPPRKSVEALSPENLFRAYVEHTFGQDPAEAQESDEVVRGVSALDSIDSELKEMLKGTVLGYDGFKEALRLLADVDSAATSTAMPSRVPDSSGNATSTQSERSNPTGVLELSSITVEGYGPFGQPPTTYPLGGRGLVLIRGLHEDQDGASTGLEGKSNGAGKTALAMAALWGLTGRTDPRPAGGIDASVGDVVHKSSADINAEAVPKAGTSWAKVTVRGQSADGSAFEIVRQRSSGNNASPKLSFVVDGVNLATQAVRDTQALVEERLGFTTSLLSRCVFYGQHPVAGLLELPDVAFKEELSAVVPLNIWADANALAKALVKTNRLEAARLSAQREIRRKDAYLRATAATVAADAASRTKASVAHEMEELQEPANATTDLEAAPLPSSVPDMQPGARITELSVKEANEVLNVAAAAAERANLIAARAEERARGANIEAMRSFELSRRTKVNVAQATSALTAAVSEGLASVNSISTSEDEEKDVWLALEDVVPKVAHDDSHDDGQGILSLIESARSFAEMRVRLAENAAGEALRSTATATARLASAIEALQVADTTHSIEMHSPVPDASAGGVDLSSVAVCGACGQPLKEGQLASHVSSLEAAVSSAKNDVGKATKLEKTAVDSARAASTLQRIVLRVVDTYKVVENAKKELHRVLLVGSTAGTAADAEANAATEARSRAVVATEELQRARAAAAAAAAADAWQKEAAASERAAAMWRAERRGRLAFEVDSVTAAATTAASHAATAAAEVVALEAQLADAERKAQLYTAITEHFGPRGASAFVLGEFVAELEGVAHGYLAALSDGALALRLRLDGDRVQRRVWVRAGGGRFVERSLAQLSGGQWRRASLALALAFTELARRRGKLSCNLLVLDEAMVHLDTHGRAKVAQLLRTLTVRPEVALTTTNGTAIPADEASSASLSTLDRERGFETVLLILQDSAADELEESFDAVDVVTKVGDSSSVSVDSASASAA